MHILAIKYENSPVSLETVILDGTSFVSAQLVFFIFHPQMYSHGPIRESVDSLCRDGADAQCMQYLRLRSSAPKAVCMVNLLL